MKHDELQLFMLIAFVTFFVLSLYKLYVLFGNPENGIDTETEYEELRSIIIAFMVKNEVSGINEKAVFELLIQDKEFDAVRYKNFNLNRYNQLIQQLFYIYNVNSFPDLVTSVRARLSDNG